MLEYKKYIDDDNEEQEFTVFIIHGHSDDWRIIERYINKKLKFKTVVLKEDFRAGEIIIDKLEDAVYDKCDCAVAIMTPDDQTTNGKFYARQNVLFELGYCHGIYDGDVIVLKEESTELHSDLHGLVFIGYKNGNLESTFSQLTEGLEEIYNYHLKGSDD